MKKQNAPPAMQTMTESPVMWIVGELSIPRVQLSEGLKILST